MTKGAVLAVFISTLTQAVSLSYKLLQRPFPFSLQTATMAKLDMVTQQTNVMIIEFSVLGGIVLLLVLLQLLYCFINKVKTSSKSCGQQLNSYHCFQNEITSFEVLEPSFQESAFPLGWSQNVLDALTVASSSLDVPRPQPTFTTFQVKAPVNTSGVMSPASCCPQSIVKKVPTLEEISLVQEVSLFLGQSSEDISKASDNMKDEIPLTHMTLVEVHPGSDQSRHATRGAVRQALALAHHTASTSWKRL